MLRFASSDGTSLQSANPDVEWLEKVRAILRYKCLTNRVDFSFCRKVNARGWQRAPAAGPQRRTFEHGPDFLAFG